MVAALLHLHEGAGAAGEFGDQVGGGFAGLHDVADGAGGAGYPGFREQFLGVADDAGDAGQGGPAGGGDLRGTAGYDDFGAGVFALGAADGLAGLALGLGSDGAGVDYHGVGQMRGVGAHDLALVGVQPAAEG